MSKNPYSHSAGHGNEHWYWQRLTAVALTLLIFWFAAFIVYLSWHERSGYAFFVETLGSPLNASLMVLFIITVAIHSSLGLQVIVEDYISHKPMRQLCNAAQRLFCVLMATIGTLSVIKIMAASSAALMLSH